MLGSSVQSLFTNLLDPPSNIDRARIPADVEEHDIVHAGDEAGGPGRGGRGAGQQADRAASTLHEPGRLPHPLRATPLSVQIDEGEPLVLKVAPDEEEGVGVLDKDDTLLAGSPVDREG